MKNKNTLTILILFVLTISSAVVSNLGGHWSWLVFILMGLSALKFILVVFEFMEIKKANSFWKFLTVSYVLGILITVVLLL